MSKIPYKTKVTIEVEIEHWGTEYQGINCIATRLLGPEMAAIKSVKIIDAQSNYRLHKEPDNTLHPVDLDNHQVVYENG